MNIDFHHFMKEAIDLAKSVRNETHPNPGVGALIIRNGEVLASGATEPAGGRHAEIVAIDQFREAGYQADSETTLLVTLEPCSTQGRTGPCTTAIIESRIKKVVVGAIDPNPSHRGKGLTALRDAGLEVIDGIATEECEDINLIFNHWITAQTPFLAAKIATTIDGRIATRGGLSKWITSDLSRQDVMKWRNYFPAIAVGAGTILADDPHLTIRREGKSEDCSTRFVFDRNLITFNDHLPKIYTDSHAEKTIVITDSSRADEVKSLTRKLGINYWLVDEIDGTDGFTQFRKQCTDHGINGVYIEGGAHLLSNLLRYQQIDYLFAYRAPNILGDHEGLSPFFGQEPNLMSDAICLKNVKHSILGDDQLIRGQVAY